MEDSMKIRFITLFIFIFVTSQSQSCENKTEGSMDPDVIRIILLDYVPSFRKCLNNDSFKSSKKSKSEGISVNFDFIIESTGEVSNIFIKSDASLSSEFTECLNGVLKKVIFPSPCGGGTVEVRQPFNFKPQN